MDTETSVRHARGLGPAPFSSSLIAERLTRTKATPAQFDYVKAKNPTRHIVRQRLTCPERRSFRPSNAGNASCAWGPRVLAATDWQPNNLNSFGLADCSLLPVSARWGRSGRRRQSGDPPGLDYTGVTDPRRGLAGGPQHTYESTRHFQLIRKSWIQTAGMSDLRMQGGGEIPDTASKGSERPHRPRCLGPRNLSPGGRQLSRLTTSPNRRHETGSQDMCACKPVPMSASAVCQALMDPSPGF